MLVSGERACVNKQMNEKELPGGSGKLCVGDRSLCVALLLAFRFTWTISPFKWQQQTKHKNKNCKNHSTRWIHTFVTWSRGPLPGTSRGILCAAEPAVRSCRPHKFNLTTSNVLHAMSEQQSEPSTGILATISIWAEAQPINHIA